MRKLSIAALAGVTIAGGAMIAESGSAQPYRYYVPPPAYSPYYYDGYYRPVPVTPYYYRDSSSSALAASVLGALLGADTGYYDRVPVDRYGPDPNGMIAPDGHRIKCKLRTNWDSYYRGYVTHRICR